MKAPSGWVDHEGKERSSYHEAAYHQRQKQIIRRVVTFARKSPSQQLESIRDHLEDTDWYWRLHNPHNDRTAYLIGLFGSGRQYVTALVQQHIGPRAKYVRNEIRVRSAATSFIYNQHATIKYVSRGQALPSITQSVFQTVEARLADLIFVYRHPLDSLLTNWVWWRTYLREKRWVDGISQVYKTSDALCADLDSNFSEFQAFAGGDPAFFVTLPGPPFLSLAQFVEETVLYVRRATLSLRFEDFTTDAPKEFAKIAHVMSADFDASRSDLSPPRSKPYGYLTVREKVPRFRGFIDQLDEDTTRWVESLGYSLG